MTKSLVFLLLIFFNFSLLDPDLGVKMNADPPGPGLTALVSFVRLSVSRNICHGIFTFHQVFPQQIATHYTRHGQRNRRQPVLTFCIGDNFLQWWFFKSPKVAHYSELTVAASVALILGNGEFSTKRFSSKFTISDRLKRHSAGQFVKGQGVPVPNCLRKHHRRTKGYLC